MERPVFSSAKRKRLRPIEPVSPAGEVFPTLEFGMATIRDADIPIRAASALGGLERAGVDDGPRAPRRRRARVPPAARGAEAAAGHRQFGGIESWTDDVDDDTQLGRGVSLTRSNGFHEGVVMDDGLLAIRPVCLNIGGGRERRLYRVARRHAGGAGTGSMWRHGVEDGRATSAGRGADPSSARWRSAWRVRTVFQRAVALWARPRADRLRPARNRWGQAYRRATIGFSGDPVAAVGRVTG